MKKEVKQEQEQEQEALLRVKPDPDPNESHEQDQGQGWTGLSTNSSFPTFPQFVVDASGVVDLTLDGF